MFSHQRVKQKVPNIYTERVLNIQESTKNHRRAPNTKTSENTQKERKNKKLEPQIPITKRDPHTISTPALADKSATRLGFPLQTLEMIKSAPSIGRTNIKLKYILQKNKS